MITLLLACSGELAPKSDPSYLEWGSWELTTTFLSQSETCSSMGASGEAMTVLYGEMDVFGENDIELSLGDMVLEGFRDDAGFFISTFQEIDVTSDDSEQTYGITAELDGTVEDLKSFNGYLSYLLDFPNGYCAINLEIDAFWLYYEPPPDCGS